jgi:hypothetical protein
VVVIVWADLAAWVAVPREWGDGMSVLEALVGAQDRSNQTAMRGAEFATNAWDNLVEGLVMKKAGNEILDLMQGGPVKPEQLAQVAQKYHLKMEQVGKLVELLKQSGAMQVPKTPQFITAKPGETIFEGAAGTNQPLQNVGSVPAEPKKSTYYNTGEGELVRVNPDGTTTVVKSARPKEQQPKIYSTGEGELTEVSGGTARVIKEPRPKEPEKITSEFDIMKSLENDTHKVSMAGGTATEYNIPLKPVIEKGYNEQLANYGKKLVRKNLPEMKTTLRHPITGEPTGKEGTTFAGYDIVSLTVGDKISGKTIKQIGKGETTGKPVYLLEDGTVIRTR